MRQNAKYDVISTQPLGQAVYGIRVSFNEEVNGRNYNDCLRMFLIGMGVNKLNWNGGDVKDEDNADTQ